MKNLMGSEYTCSKLKLIAGSIPWVLALSTEGWLRHCFLNFYSCWHFGIPSCLTSKFSMMAHCFVIVAVTGRWWWLYCWHCYLTLSLQRPLRPRLRGAWQQQPWRGPHRRRRILSKKLVLKSKAMSTPGGCPSSRSYFSFHHQSYLFHCLEGWGFCCCVR